MAVPPLADPPLPESSGTAAMSSAPDTPSGEAQAHAVTDPPPDQQSGPRPDTPGSTSMPPAIAATPEGTNELKQGRTELGLGPPDPAAGAAAPPPPSAPTAPSPSAKEPVSEAAA